MADFGFPADMKRSLSFLISSLDTADYFPLTAADELKAGTYRTVLDFNVHPQCLRDWRLVQYSKIGEKINLS